MAPTLFDQIEFWVEFRKKNGREVTFLAKRLECRFNSGEIGLVEKETAATAVNAVCGTLKVLALCVEACLLKKPSLHENYGHALEDTSVRVPFREVERLRLAIWEHPIGHPNSLLQLLSIGPVNRATSFICHINFHKPVYLLLWLLGIWLRCVLGHVSSGEGTWWLFCVDGGIVENEDVVIVRIVLLEDIHRIIDLPQNVLVGEVPLPVCPRLEKYSSRLHSVRGTQPAIVGRDEV